MADAASVQRLPSPSATAPDAAAPARLETVRELRKPAPAGEAPVAPKAPAT